MKPMIRIARRAPAGRFVLPCALLFSTFVAAPAAAQDTRFDPVLREALRPATRASLAQIPDVSGLVPGQEPLPPAALALRREAGGVVHIGVFVRVTGDQGVASVMAAGGLVGSRVGDVVSARVPLDRVDALAGAPGIAFVEAARAVRAEHDTSMIAIRADAIRTRVGDTWTGATGEGTLFALYDSGLDLDHHDFRDPAGRSRVLSVWDQTTGGNAPPGYGYGFVCDSAAVAVRAQSTDFNACPMRDFTGHGTHVSGSAAGDGSATGNGRPAHRYAGVAPEAKLIVVKGGNGTFFENLIIDGLFWLKSEAQRLGRPAVVNLSLGGQFGPHDGTRLYEQAIDELSGPGFIVVVSAGNQGVNRNTTPETDGRLIHARGFATGTETKTFTLELPDHTPHADLCNGNITQIAFWYDGADRLSLEVVRPTGSSLVAPFSRAVAQDDPAGRIAIDNASGGTDARNGDYGVQIRIDGCGPSGAPAAGTWQLKVTPEGEGTGEPYDMWVEITSHGTGVPGTAMRGGVGFDNRFVVGSPGNATRAITVAAFATRMCWPSQADIGSSCYVQREQVGDLARFSSGGPRRDGVIKPEIAAPGIGIMSARSGSAGVGSSRAEPDGAHFILEGTSMASPHVAGTIAALFQAKPDLTPEEAREILMSTALADGFTARVYGAAGVPADWWGAGKLDAQGALLTLTGSGPAVLALSTATAIPEGTTLAPRGTRLPLLALRLSSQGTEPIDVTALTFDVSGDDPGAYLVLVRDANDSGVLDDGDVAVDSVAAAVSGGQRTVTVSLAPGTLRIPALGATTLFAALSLSGAAPNGTAFAATFVPGETESVGVRTGAANELNVAQTPLASGTATTTVLAQDELLSFSANPVRLDHVVFNFAEPPTTAAIYTLAGRRVADLVAEGALSVRWDLTNDEGGRVAPGVYLIVFRVGEQLFREKLVVLTPGDRSP